MKPETPKCQNCGAVTLLHASYCVQCGQAIIELRSGRVGRLIKSKSIRAAPFLLAISFFFLPWFTWVVSPFTFREPQATVEVTGVELVAGIDQVTSHGDDWKLHPEPISIIVLAIALVGAVVSIRGDSRRPYMGAVLSLVGIGFLWFSLWELLYLSRWVEQSHVSSLGLDLELGLGYYLLSGAFLVGALINAGMVQAVPRRPVVLSILLITLLHGSCLALVEQGGPI